MENWQAQWLKLGKGIELMRCQPAWDWKKSSQENLSEIKSGDLLSIKITEPKRYLIAVDTGVRPKSFTTNNTGPVILATRADWVYEYPSARTIQCTCFDAESEEWCTAELTLGYINFEPDLRFKALLTPPAKSPATDMKTALKRCIEGLNSGRATT